MLHGLLNLFPEKFQRVCDSRGTCLREISNVFAVYGERVRNLRGTGWKFIAKLMEIERNRNAFGIGGCLV